ncbi:MAG: M48 family metallopeptidase [Prevotellaceae bacterium]|nr:M48 family metallopeptidase [Candidatus Colivivens equi]
MGILRPFFVLYKSGRDERIEITESEAPELVHLIYKIADLTQNDRPKHIYVSAVANACVFFDTRFTNIFVPVKKNIEIGLGVFKHMSVAETASCIAHEFGHFSQDTMRWGTVVHILNTLIANLMSVNDRWNTMVNKLINFPWIIGQSIVMSLACKAAGWILYGITIGYMSIMEAIYKKIQLAHLELSRKMEYEADSVAAKIVGSDVYVSFASKLMEISKRENVFFGMAQRMASRNLLINDYWKAYSQTDKYIAELTDSKVYTTTKLSEPLNQVEDAKLVFEAVYSSHPDWNSRISAVKSANYPKSTEFEGRAWDLIPESVKERVAKQSKEDLVALSNSENPMKEVTEEELAQIIDHDNYWQLLAPYFQRDIIEFDYNECTPNSSFELGDKKTISIINKYNSAKGDYDNARALKNHNDISKAIYQGVVYKTSNLPIEEIKSVYEMQKKRAMEIDKSICEYAMSRVSDIEFIKEAYRRLFYAQKFLDSFGTLVSKQQNDTINILNKSASNTNSHQYATIKESLEELNSCLKNYGLDKMDKDLFGQYAPDNAINCTNEYMKHCDSMFYGDSISGESINLLIYTCNWIRDVHDNILSSAKMAIIDACLGRIKDSE